MMPIDFSPIHRLKLRMAFTGDSHFDAVQCDDDLLSELFEYSNRRTLFVYDDAEVGHSIYVSDTKGIGRDKMLKVDNVENQGFFLWHIDGVMYEKNTKCDCALLSDQHMLLVEFKSNAGNASEASIEENYKKAASQIEETLHVITEKCEQVEIEVRKIVKVEAYAVFNRTVPGNDASRKNIAAKFLKNTNVKLKFENKVILVN